MDYQQAIDKDRSKQNRLWHSICTWVSPGKSIGPCDIYEFKKARNLSWLIQLARIIYLYLLKFKYPNFTVDAVCGIAQVTELKTDRVILCPNHPSTMDTDMAFLLAKVLKQELYFLTAREVFMGSFINKYLLQLFGCYSVLRGLNDFNSFKHSVRILLSGRHKIVIFPEGEVSGRNDLLLPLKPGPAHIACTTLNRLRESDSDAKVYMVPVALRYSYPDASDAAVAAAMLSIENALNIVAADQTIHDRLAQAWEHVLKELLAKYACEPTIAASFLQRIKDTRTAILKAISSYIEYKPDAGLDETDWIHHLFLHLYEERWYEEQLEERLDFDTHHDRYRVLTELLRDLHRVSCCILIATPSECSDSNDEINAILLLSNEVLGSARCAFRVHLNIAFGSPIDVATIYDGSKTQKLKSIMDITSKINSELKAQLVRLINLETQCEQRRLVRL